MITCICEMCKKEKEHYAKGLCKKCYDKKWKKDNQDMVKSSNKKWEKDNRDKINSNMRRYRKNNYEKLREVDVKRKNKIYKKEICEIIKSHDIRHENDPESLDIRKFLNVKCE